MGLLQPSKGEAAPETTNGAAQQARGGQGLLGGGFRQGSTRPHSGLGRAGLGGLGGLPDIQGCESYDVGRAGVGGKTPALKSCCTAARTKMGFLWGRLARQATQRDQLYESRSKLTTKN